MTSGAVLALFFLAAAAPAAQNASGGSDDATSGAAFSLASSRTFTSRDAAFIHLTFQRIGFLDLRVYKVKDPIRFFAALRDPHQLGSPDPVVPQERTWLERIAAWKADRRDQIREFGRAQLSFEYRRVVRVRQDTEQVAQRRTVRFSTFAQMPLLNREQLVASWREMLPPVREAEARRVPIEVNEPGVYLVEGVNPPHKAYTVVVISDIGLVTKTAPGQMLVYAANRFTGEPAAGCHVDAIIDHKVATNGITGADGTYDANLSDLKVEAIVTVARCGNQVAVADPGAWYLQEPARHLVGYVYTDRPIYRPGHTVRIKTVFRWRARGALLPFDRRQAEVVISDGNDKVLMRAQRPVDEFGSLLADFTVPAGASLGYYSIRINTGDEHAEGTFEVQEYRKPEFDVAVTTDSRFAVQGRSIAATIRARYYFGQPVSGAVVKYAIYRSRYWSPLRWSDGEDEDGWYDEGELQFERDAKLGADGSATVPVTLPVDEEGRDYTYRVEARVIDASGREVSGRGSVHATYGTFLISAMTDQYVYRPGASAELRLRAMDYMGAPQANVSIQVALEQLTYADGRYESPTVSTITTARVTTDAQGLGSWTIALPATAGDYRFAATSRAGDRDVMAQASAWVPGRTEAENGEDSRYDRYLELVADKKTYQPGETARILIRGEDFASKVLVTKESQYVSYHHVVAARANEVIEVPIAEDDLGDTYVNIAFLKDDRLYRAEKRLTVPAFSRQIQLTVSAAQDVSRPREPGIFTIKATDQTGRPVRAQLSLGVVDEAVYGVKPDQTPDPLRFFYRREYSRVGTEFSREYSFIGYSGTQQLLLAQRRRPFTLADFKADRPARPAVRKEFPDAIFWAGDVVTDETGTATVRVTYPDSLTTWRVTARAVTRDTRVGSGIARTITTRDLILRVITPRFLTEGDSVTIPTIVHNYLPDPKTVAVSVETRGLNAADPAAPPSRSLAVMSAGEQRADWTFTAARPGTAAVIGTATTEGNSDAVEVSLPVLPFGVRRETAAAGSLSGTATASAELTIPEPSNSAARTISVSLTPTLAGSLFGALDFLTSFPYGCTEQTLSSFLPNLQVLRALEQLKIAPTERLGTLDRQVSEGLSRLYDYQHEDGGWGWWKTDKNHPFMTAYALYGLIEVKHAGYKVDQDRLMNGARRLAALYREYPRAVADLKAYMAYVLIRGLEGGVERDAIPSDSFEPSKAIDDLWQARSRMSPYGQALLLLTLDLAKDARGAQLARHLLASVRTRGDVAWWDSQGDPLLDDFADTSVEATALIVKALAARDARNPVLERAVRWLLLNRNHGSYWSSTKQTAMVLYGLLDFMKARGETPAPFEVDVLINGERAATRSFTTASWTEAVPVIVTAAAAAGTNKVEIVKRGGTSLYWSATARYFYNGGELAPSGSRKLAIVRQYYSLAPVQQKGRMVYRETAFSGIAKPGDLLLVRLTIAGATDWRYLVIEDPLPAGAEPVPQQSLYALERRSRGGYESRREYRDDRVALFQEDLAHGRYEFTYLLRVITPGSFRAMPAQVTPMYVPGVAATSNAQQLVVPPPDGASR